MIEIRHWKYYKTENWTENIAPSTEVWLVIYTANTLLDPHIVCVDQGPNFYHGKLYAVYHFTFSLILQIFGLWSKTVHLNPMPVNQISTLKYRYVPFLKFWYTYKMNFVHSESENLAIIYSPSWIKLLTKNKISLLQRNVKPVPYGLCVALRKVIMRVIK